MELLSRHAKLLFGFHAGPVACRTFAADEQETEEESDGPCAYDRYYGNGTPAHHPGCSSIENAAVEGNDAEFDEAQGQSLLQLEWPEWLFRLSKATVGMVN